VPAPVIEQLLHVRRRPLPAELVHALEVRVVLARDTAEQMLQRGGRTVRRTFVIPTQWKHCAISRDDLRLDTPRGRAAREAMGQLPQDVLDGTRRAGHALTIRKAATARAAVVSDNTSTPTVDPPPDDES